MSELETLLEKRKKGLRRETELVDEGTQLLCNLFVLGSIKESIGGVNVRDFVKAVIEVLMEHLSLRRENEGRVDLARG